MFFTKTKRCLEQTQNELNEYKKNYEDVSLLIEKIKTENAAIIERYSTFIDREAAIKKTDQEILAIQ